MKKILIFIIILFSSNKLTSDIESIKNNTGKKLFGVFNWRDDLNKKCTQHDLVDLNANSEQKNIGLKDCKLGSVEIFDESEKQKYMDYENSSDKFSVFRPMPEVGSKLDLSMLGTTLCDYLNIYEVKGKRFITCSVAKTSGFITKTKFPKFELDKFKRYEDAEKEFSRSKPEFQVSNNLSVERWFQSKK